MFGRAMPLSKIMFNKYDTDGSGSINPTEFKYMAYDLGYYISDNELDLAVKTVDSSGTGSITYDDFSKWWKNSDRWSKIQLTDENAAILSSISLEFQKFDTDKNGTLDINEFKQFVAEITKKVHLSPKEVEEMFAQLDTNHDNKISFNEYVDYLSAKYKGDLSKYKQ